jgi:hypothetical protein
MTPECDESESAIKGKTMRTLSTARLRTVESEEEVLELVREFVGEWMPEELGQIPAECRPGRMHDMEDLNEVAFRLTQEKYANPELQDNPLVLEMQTFLAEAVTRIGEIKTLQAAQLHQLQQRSKTQA